MDSQIIQTVANLGGFATMAAALLWLHVTALRAFREELAAERAAFLTRNQAVVDAIGKQTDALAVKLDRLSASLSEVCHSRPR